MWERCHMSGWLVTHHVLIILHHLSTLDCLRALIHWTSTKLRWVWSWRNARLSHRSLRDWTHVRRNMHTHCLLVYIHLLLLIRDLLKRYLLRRVRLENGRRLLIRRSLLNWNRIIIEPWKNACQMADRQVELVEVVGLALLAALLVAVFVEVVLLPVVKLWLPLEGCQNDGLGYFENCCRTTGWVCNEGWIYWYGDWNNLLC